MNVELKNLETGQWRHLTDDELAELLPRQLTTPK
jgi:16S rRNA U516 pseudouridylate synthase RsuA-like enzyme